jgi:hypothetical protein
MNCWEKPTNQNRKNNGKTRQSKRGTTEWEWKTIALPLHYDIIMRDYKYAFFQIILETRET